MPSGSKTIDKQPAEAADRLRTMLAAANCSVTAQGDGVLTFKHGTYLTQSAPLMPKQGRFSLQPEGEGTRISYSIELAPFAKLWIGLWGVLFCWLVFPAVIAYRAICVHPQRMVENMIAGV